MKRCNKPFLEIRKSFLILKQVVDVTETIHYCYLEASLLMLFYKVPFPVMDSWCIIISIFAGPFPVHSFWSLVVCIKPACLPEVELPTCALRLSHSGALRTQWVDRSRVTKTANNYLLLFIVVICQSQVNAFILRVTLRTFQRLKAMKDKTEKERLK